MARVRVWWSEPRLRAITALTVALLAGVTAITWLFGDEPWSRSAEYGLLWLSAVVIAFGIGVGPHPHGKQYRLTVGPGLALWALAVPFPDWIVFFGGAGSGWMIVADTVLQGRTRMEYQAAIRAMRRGDYDGAIRQMDALVARAPDAAEHRRFRAELHRLAGHLKQARADYDRVVALEPDDAAGYLGLAELAVQQGDLEHARSAALEAQARARGNWAPAYTLGMIEDRRGDAAAAMQALDTALVAPIPDARFRLLARLWLARNAYRLGQTEAARAHLDSLRREAKALREWQLVFDSPHGSALRAMLGADVAQAERLLDPAAPLSILDEIPGSRPEGAFFELKTDH